MQPHQRRILGRIPDQIRAYREGRQTLIRTLNNVWGLYTAAELRDGSNGKQFIGLYFGVSREDDLLQPWAPAGYGSSARLEAAIRALETWAIDIRETDDSGDIDAPERPDRGTR